MERWNDNSLIYQYLSLEDGLKVLVDNELKFSHPSEFNDPYDCFAELMKFENLTERVFDEYIEKGMVIIKEHEKMFPKKQLIQLTKERLSDLESEEFKEIFKRLNQEIWISCFSKSYNEILMWSHYAEKHKGVCIGFNIEGLSNTFNFGCTEVTYQKELVREDYCLKPEIATKHWISCKFIDLQYEKEVRLFTDLENANININGIISINKESISEIILGCNCCIPKEKARRIFDAKGFENIPIIQLEKSKYSFGFEEIEL